MWKARVYPLSLLIAVFSGGWPYLKLLLMLFCWFVPREKLPTDQQNKILLALDALGKWSLVDSYLLVAMMVAFRFHLVNPQVMIPFDFASILVTVEPHFGFYGFLIATIVSLVMSHVMLFIFRRAEAQDGERGFSFGRPSDITDPSNAGEIATHEECLCCHVFSYKESVIWCTRFGSWAVGIVLSAAMVLVWVGATVPSFSFDFQGAAGLALELTGGQKNQPYSLFTLAAAVSNPWQHDPGIYFIQSCFLLFAVGTPIAQLAVLLALWCIPLSAQHHHGLFIASEVLGAWAGLEVFIVSIVASLLELSQFAHFIIGDRCDQINQLLKEFMPDLFPAPDQPTCFDVISTLQFGCLYLFGSALISAIVGQVVTRLAERALDERSDRSYASTEDFRDRCLAEVGGGTGQQGDEFDEDFQPNRWIRCLRALGLIALRRR